MKLSSRGKYTILTFAFTEAAQDFIDDGRNPSPICPDRQMRHSGIQRGSLAHQFGDTRSHICHPTEQRSILSASHPRHLLAIEVSR